MEPSSHAPGGHAHDIDVTARTRRVLTIVTIAMALVVVVGMFAIGFGTDVEASNPELLTDRVYEAKVLDVGTGPCAGTTVADGIECELVQIELTQGPDAGDERTLSFSVDSDTSPDLGRGDRIVVSYAPDADEGSEYAYADRQRRPVLIAAAIVFAIAVVALGRLRGLAALGGVVISLGLILTFVLPAILEGHSPVLVAVLGSAAIAYVALYLSHGLTALTTVALLGTLAALALTVLLSAVFTAVANFSGFASEEALLVGALASDVDVSGLVLAGIVIGALGALDDVTVTQASAVAELRAADPEMPHHDVYRAGVRIGRDHIASTVNTLALAYAGAALPVMLLFVLSRQSLGTVANSEVIAIEIIRTLVGSIGLVAAVPITTWLASRVVSRPPPTDVPPPTPPPSPHEPADHDADAGWDALMPPPPPPRGRRRSSAEPDDGEDDESSFWS
jgi:uncharacterized membrane protein